MVTVGDVAVRVTRDELDRLLEALAGLGQRDADAVRGEIMALRLVGGTIRLLPNEAELAALEAALAEPAREALVRDPIPVGEDGIAAARDRR